jgi:hypothetical protein
MGMLQYRRKATLINILSFNCVISVIFWGSGNRQEERLGNKGFAQKLLPDFWTLQLDKALVRSSNDLIGLVSVISGNQTALVRFDKYSTASP